MQYVANARMYSISPGAAAAWKDLFEWLSHESGVGLRVIDHAFPLPLAELWSRPDLACGFMCGFPFIQAKNPPKPVAAPVPLAAPIQGRAGLRHPPDRRRKFVVPNPGGYVRRTSRLHRRRLPFGIQRVAASPAAVSSETRRQPVSRKHRTSVHAAPRDRSGPRAGYRPWPARRLCIRSDVAS